ncbi:hypothetical protein ACWDUC_14170 [Streptomyces tricolor]
MSEPTAVDTLYMDAELFVLTAQREIEPRERIVPIGGPRPRLIPDAGPVCPDEEPTA